ncbi:MAG TPA: heme-binding protein [Pseudolabrys sp.]|nr:heme-binding protein [Pseudolabrys sp.]
MRRLWLLILLATLGAPVRAEESLVTFKSMTVEVALDLARGALADCRKRGYQVAVAVVDRFGVTQVVLRDRYAGAFAVTTATGKAWTAVNFRNNTGDIVAITPPGTGVRALPGATVSAGGVLVEAAGTLVGAIGVSGAPGGDNDEACAKAGIAAIRDRLDF